MSPRKFSGRYSRSGRQSANPVSQFAGICHYEIVKVPGAQTALKLVDYSLHLCGGVMGTGDIEGLTLMPILEMGWAGHRVYIAESQHKVYVSYMGGPVFAPVGEDKR